MEPSYFGTPYLTTSSPDSVAIRELLDQQEAEYETWRSNRKPIRHLFATPKLNSPLQSLRQDRGADCGATTAKPLWLALLERSERPSKAEEEEARRESTASHVSGGNQRRGTSSRVASASGPPSSASTSQLPALHRGQLNSTSTSTSSPMSHRLSTAASLTSLSNQRSDDAFHHASGSRRKKPSAAKRKLQKNLYDFHSSIVFSIASVDDSDTLLPQQPPTQQEQLKSPKLEPVAEQSLDARSENQTADVVLIELPPQEEDTDPYVVTGLQVLDGASVFDSLFEYDWAHSDVDRIVRDAVERKRIYAILKKWYRVVVLYFRQYAAKTALGGSRAVVDLTQIPNRLSLLEDLNVQCVDPAKFGLVESPLRRDGLIAFVLQTARMVAAHPVAHPVRFRMFAMEGIEMSEAVRCLLVDHVAVYAQIQDTNHFRDLFLINHHNQDRQRRRLRYILTKHDASVSRFFFEMIAVNTLQERQRYTRQQPQASTATTMSFPAFIGALRMIGVVAAVVDATSRRRPTQAPGTDAPGAVASASAAQSVLDESRAMRVFQLCLDVSAELHTRAASAGSGSVSTRQQLAYPQFVEALLRVALLRKEKLICHGGVDICPDQQTSDVCKCRGETASTAYDFGAFDDAIEELFTVIQSYLTENSRKRSAIKTTSVKTMNNALQSSGGPSVGLGRRHHVMVMERDHHETEPLEIGSS